MIASSGQLPWVFFMRSASNCFPFRFRFSVLFFRCGSGRIFCFNNCLCRFMVELEEVDSVTGVNKEKTGEQVFKTVAKPTVSSSLDKSNFKVSYHWNKIKQHIDLTKADIVLDTSLITYPSCLDSIQVCFLYLLYFPLVGF